MIAYTDSPNLMPSLFNFGLNMYIQIERISYELPNQVKFESLVKD